MPASNTEKCFLEFIGQRVVGVLMGPKLRPGIPSRTNVKACLIFEDGRGLCWYDNGAFYVETAEQIRMAVDHRRDELKKETAKLHHVVDIAEAIHVDRRGKKGAKSKSKASTRDT